MNVYAIAAIILGLIGSHFWAYGMGKDACRIEAEHAALEHREKENKLILELEDAKAKREVVYKDRIKVVQGVADPGGCLDAPFPQPFVDGLRGSRSPETKSKPNG